MDPSFSTNITVSLQGGGYSHEERSPADDDQENSIVRSMSEKINSLPKRPDTIYGPTIFRVPANLRKNKEHLIEPSVVSIGPYHRCHKHLAPMEDKKWLLLQDILSRLDNEVTLKTCVETIKGLQLQARSCYSERVDMDDDSFVEMLILDGTFITQFIFRSSDWFKRETGWASSCIKTDLILLENQIPFFVVQSLWDLYYACLTNLALYSHFRLKFWYDLQSEDNTIPQDGFDHLLHLCYHYVVPDMSTHQTVLPGCFCIELCAALNSRALLPCVSSKHENPHIYKIPCATELEEAGIKFRRKKSPCKMMDITFQGGKLEIPFLYLGDRIKPLFINLLAFEQSRHDYFPRHLISYAAFMDSIINTEHDVAILQRHGIIENLLSGEEEVALFFNQLCQGTDIFSNHYLSDMFKEVNQYCESKYHRNRANLVRDYFNSPWSIMSFIAAVIILGLAFSQTYFAGYDHFHPPSPK